MAISKNHLSVVLMNGFLFILGNAPLPNWFRPLTPQTCALAALGHMFWTCPLQVPTQAAAMKTYMNLAPRVTWTV